MLLLLESAYDWKEGGVTCSPGPDHSSEIVEDAILKPLDGSPTMVKVTQALCGRADPSPEEAGDGWGRVALTEYIGRSLGCGSARPTSAHWLDAEQQWPHVLELLRPRTVILLGRTMWNNMPRTQEVVSAYVQGYALKDGAIAMCFATFHPSPRAGRDWRFFADFFAEVEAWRR